MQMMYVNTETLYVRDEYTWIQVLKPIPDGYLGTVLCSIVSRNQFKLTTTEIIGDRKRKREKTKAKQVGKKKTDRLLCFTPRLLLLLVVGDRSIGIFVLAGPCTPPGRLFSFLRQSIAGKGSAAVPCFFSSSILSSAHVCTARTSRTMSQPNFLSQTAALPPPQPSTRVQTHTAPHTPHPHPLHATGVNKSHRSTEARLWMRLDGHCCV